MNTFHWYKHPASILSHPVWPRSLVHSIIVLVCIIRKFGQHLLGILCLCRTVALSERKKKENATQLSSRVFDPVFGYMVLNRHGLVTGEASVWPLGMLRLIYRMVHFFFFLPGLPGCGESSDTCSSKVTIYKVIRVGLHRILNWPDIRPFFAGYPAE